MMQGVPDRCTVCNRTESTGITWDFLGLYAIKPGMVPDLPPGSYHRMLALGYPDPKWLCQECYDSLDRDLVCAARHRCLLDPRQPGMVCYSGYWHKEFRVIKVRPPTGLGEGYWFVEQDLVPPDRLTEARVRHHCTPWDWSRDRIISRPGVE